MVPIASRSIMARALQSAESRYELIELTGEDHWMMTSSASRIRTLTELERFLGSTWQRAAAQPPPVADSTFDCNLQTRAPAPMYARLTFTGATGFDVGSEP